MTVACVLGMSGGESCVLTCRFTTLAGMTTELSDVFMLFCGNRLIRLLTDLSFCRNVVDAIESD